jgi:murein DD-endopeptidase MepM/ murein hydrolase activator NlpD
LRNPLQLVARLTQFTPTLRLEIRWTCGYLLTALHNKNGVERVVSKKVIWTDWKSRLAGWFVDREIFMRSNGHVRFIRISAQLQRRVAAVVASVIGVWLIITLGMMINQFSVSIERLALVRKQENVESAAQRVAKYRNSIDDVAKELEKRQKMSEDLFRTHFGAEPPKPAPGAAASETAAKIGAAVPEAATLAQIEARQIAFVEGLTRIALDRSRKAEAAIRGFGLDPKQMAKEADSAMGGPFIPFFGSKSEEIRDPRFTRLASVLQKMSALERAVKGIPTSMPAAVALMSSGFGYRSDPFTGGGAMHSGLDFKGPLGTDILAAADGTVSFAGWQGGYGNTVELTHANGLVTRYAHLSRVTVSLGVEVKRGVGIGRMGSTGRSTGSHLHFEVRVNGSAINPMKFLEANPDVFEVQAIAGNRSASIIAGTQ